MSPSLVAVLAAALAAAEPPAPAPADPIRAGDQYAYASVIPPDVLLGAIPAEELEGALLSVLPPPPTIVVRQTHYYGTVTVDHRAHLARRISCKLCHGPKPVNKIVFTPRLAHERCVGCHQKTAKAPTRCQGCHVKSATPPPIVVATAASPAAAEVPAAPAPNPANVAAALAAFDAPRPGEGAGMFAQEPFHRRVELGLLAGHGLGVSARLAFQQDRVLLTQGLDRMSSSHDARTIGLFGAGLSRPMRSVVSVQALGLVGFDVVDHPIVALFPAVGVRAGVEVRPRHRLVQQLTASVSGVVDLSPRAYRSDIGGISIYATLALGIGDP